MFLHSGASLHGHDFSNPNRPASVPALNRRSPLLRSPFVPPLSRTITPSPAPEQQHAPRFQSPKPLQSCMPQRPSSRLHRRSTPEPVVRFQEEPAVIEVEKPAAVASAAKGLVSEEEGSCSDFEASDCGGRSPRSAGGAGASERRRQRFPRKTNTYFFAHPPPRHVKKRLMKQVRPKLLLQLHHLSVDRRPKPILDVFPASNISGPVVGGRFAKRFPRIFNVMGEKSELGSQDVILFRSEEYNADGAGDDDDDDELNLNRRELVAVLSPLRRENRTEIVLDDGAVWVAESLPNGSFEFTHTDELGAVTTARWVRRSLTKSSSPISPAREIAAELNHLANLEATSPAMLGSPLHGSSAPDEYRYTFSMIDPKSRRHPIMATLTQSTLDILDNYTTVSTSSARYPPTRSFKGSVSGGGASLRDEDDDDEDDAPTPRQERRSCPVDPATRNLISIAAVWVTLRLGGIMPASAAPEPAKLHRARTSSVSSVNPATLHKANGSAGPAGTPHAHRLSGRFEPSPTFPPAGFASQTSGGLPRSLTPLPRRATSTGAAFVQRRMAMSDVSDTERPSAPGGRNGLRSKGKRVFSGDWGSAFKRNSTHITEVEIPTPSSESQTAASATTGSVATSSEIQSTPASSRPSSGPTEQHLQQQQQQHHQEAANQPEQLIAFPSLIQESPLPQGQPQSKQQPPPHPHPRPERKTISAYYTSAPPYMTVGTDELNSGGVALGLRSSSTADGSGGASLGGGPTRTVGATGVYIGGHFGGHGGGVYIGGHFGGGGAGGETDAENGRGEKKWKRLSHWIRKFGH